MRDRDEALRKVFDATGVTGELSAEQARELRAHLDDAIQAKVDAGVPELEALGHAFAELGDLKKLSRQFRREPVRIGGAAELGYLLLLAFVGIQTLLTPLVLGLFGQIQAPLPRLTLVFAELSSGMRAFWPLLLVAFVALAVLLVRFPRRSRWRPVFDGTLAIGGAGLFGGALAGVILPLITLLNGLLG